MKIERDDIAPEVYQAIAEIVIETLKPVMSGMLHDPTDRWMTVKQLSEYSGMSSQWIYNNKRSLPHVNIGDKPLFRKSEIDAWLENCRVQKPDTCKTRPVKMIHADKPLKIRGFNNQKCKAVTSS